jgi:4-amino-4-deoxy-L-arabinose transferase-like glycosyltransferase
MNQHYSPYNSNRTLWVLAISFVLIWLYMLGARTLVPTDEGRYAEMAREMVASGDWITQRLNGIKYFEKPPLQNWMNAISFELFGLGDWQARLWTGLCGLLGIAATSYTALRLYNRRVAISSALILGSSFFWAGLGHVNTLDMGLASMMTLALCGLMLAQRNGATSKEQRNGMLLCWAGMALATMSKGLIGFVLPGAVLVIYTIWTRDIGLWTRLHMGKGLILFFAITAPWFILVWQANPEHPHFFFIHEHFQRFTSTVHRRAGAWHYFFPLLALGIIPWLGFLLQSIWGGFKEKNNDNLTNATQLKNGAINFSAQKMLLIWAIFIFFFFSISGSKLPSYILPIFPALAILIALELEKTSLTSLRVNASLLITIGVAGLIYAPTITSKAKNAYELPLYESMVPWAIGAAAITLLGGLAAFFFSRKNKDLVVMMMAISGFLGGQIIFIGHDQWGEYSAGIKHVPAMQAELSPSTPIYSVGSYEQAIPFYLQRTSTLVEQPDEMEFGLTIQPELWIPKLDDFIVKWKAHYDKKEKALAILSVPMYKKLKEQALPMRVIGEDPKRVIVTPN